MELPFGQIIQRARRKKCWTVKWLIKKLGEDLTPADITKIEVHGHIPSLTVIARLATELDLDLKELIFAATDNKRKTEDWNKKQREEAVTLCTYTQEKYDNYQRKAASRKDRDAQWTDSWTEQTD